MDFALELFTAGLVLGSSQCMISCTPLLAIFVAGTSEGWHEGVKATLIFSFSRLLAYVVLGLLAGVSGTCLADLVQNPRFGSYLWIGAGTLIFLLGVLIILGREPRFPLCRALSHHAIGDSAKSMALLGFIVGVAPCAPLLGVITYIAFSVKDALLGAAYAFCFGVGASIVTPVLALGILSSIIPRLLFKNPRILDIFRQSCGLLFVFFGARLIMDSVG